jgi:dTDP-4-amino-4,6-dideoxygalactose transaminase
MGRIKKLVPIMCSTLGRDDVYLAEHLLSRPDSWADPLPVAKAEQWLARWLGLEEAFGFMGGRAALFSIAKALGIGRGDEVIVPGLTCQVVTNAFEYNGAVCVHADIEEQTLNMDVARMGEKIGPRTRAVLLQHTFGVPARDTRAIVDLAAEHGLTVIEDVAHGLGGSLGGKKLGTFGDVSFFSTERTKIINTIHGGFAATSDPEIRKGLSQVKENAGFPPEQKIREILNTLLFCYHTKVSPDRVETFDWATRHFGQTLIPQMTDLEFEGRFEPMYGWRMPGPVGALAMNQLQKFESFIPGRRAAAAKWTAWAEQKGYGTVHPDPDAQCAWIRYPVLVPRAMKKDTTWIEDELGMEPGVWFTTPRHPRQDPIPGIPIGWKIAGTVVNLPTGLWVK